MTTSGPWRIPLVDLARTIAPLTGKNPPYDDRVRGRVTIVSPTQITVEEAYAVFESVLQVKGFTTVQAPGGAIKVIPLREAKESNVETKIQRPKLNSARAASFSQKNLFFRPGSAQIESASFTTFENKLPAITAQTS